MQDISLDQFTGRHCYELMHQSAVPCSMCVRHKLRYHRLYERKFFDFELKGLLKLQDKFLDVNGRKCIIEIVDRVPKEATYDEIGGAYTDKSILNDLLRKSMYEHDPKRSIAILLEQFGRYLRTDRAQIGELEDHNCFSATYEWCRYGVQPMRSKRQHKPIELFALWNHHLLHGEAVVIDHIAQLKEKSPQLYQELLKNKIESIIVYPLWKDGKIGGFYAFENPDIQMMDEAYPILRTIGHFIESLMVSRDLIQQLEYISYSDRMTGFGNRFAFDRYQTSLMMDKSIGLVFCDVSGLKKTNDTLGHAAGDRLILRAADAIAQAFGDYALFRVGGDEFLVVASQITERDFHHRLNLLHQYSVEKHAPFAIGSAWKESIEMTDLTDLLELVDQRMCADKESYYSLQSSENTSM